MSRGKNKNKGGKSTVKVRLQTTGVKRCLLLDSQSRSERERERERERDGICGDGIVDFYAKKTWNIKTKWRKWTSEKSKQKQFFVIVTWKAGIIRIIYNIFTCFHPFRGATRGHLNRKCREKSWREKESIGEESPPALFIQCTRQTLLRKCRERGFRLQWMTLNTGKNYRQIS